IIGSSNFTAGGIYNNIETNAIIDDPIYLQEIDREFFKLWESSFRLQPSDLEAFKIIFENFKKNAEKEKKEQGEFEKKILAN
ncbi:phospholipase D-like domain-containing protein, partial [Bacillus sp. SIMBA_005]|uniref:phospholipase D-like domain-containing protein n=1 Tax=Bacillus sp. SIMBA_005 TaxID=3085754 RepID=UPI00397C0ECA